MLTVKFPLDAALNVVTSCKTTHKHQTVNDM